MAAEASWEAFPMPLGSTVALFIPQAFSTPGGIERDRFCGSLSLTTEIGDKFKPVQFGDQASASLTCSNKKSQVECMADHRETVYAPSARSECDADLELPMINNSSHHWRRDHGGISFALPSSGTIRPIPNNSCTACVIRREPPADCRAARDQTWQWENVYG
jgi:hypothetical protein